MIIAGLTGSIAMGKTETAKLFAARGIPVFDSDAAVHELYAKNGEAVPVIAALAPSAIKEDAVDRGRLAALVLADPPLLKRIEGAVHPLVKARQKDFLVKAREQGCDVAILDIPLLFETAREGDVDLVIVVSTGPELQRERALKRPGMTPEKLDFILSRQVPDNEKRARADFVIDTSVSLAETGRTVDRVLDQIRAIARS